MIGLVSMARVKSGFSWRAFKRASRVMVIVMINAAAGGRCVITMVVVRSFIIIRVRIYSKFYKFMVNDIFVPS